MGIFASSRDISIAVCPPTGKFYDFHNPRQGDNDKQSLTFPSFIKKTDANKVQYSLKSRYSDRQYQIRLEEDEGYSTLVLHKIFQNSSSIWKSLGIAERIELKQGQTIKLADVQFTIRKICRNYDELQGWEQNFRTLSEIDLHDNINLGNSIMRGQSRNMKKSKFLDSKSYFRVESVQNIKLSEDDNRDSCRICFGKESNEINPLLNICKCSGSIKYLHYGCLKTWINTRSITKYGDVYEYFQYNLSCDLCKQKINKTITFQGKKYVVYGESMIHPPFAILNYKDSGTKVRQYVINFHSQKQITIGRGSRSDIILPDRSLSMEQCRLIFDNKQLYLQNCNPVYGTFVELTDQSLLTNQREVELMVNNHLIRIKDESTHCYGNEGVRIKLKSSC